MTASTMTEAVEVYPAYWTVGEDFAEHLEAAQGDVRKGLHAHAERLEGVARLLRQIAGVVHDSPAEGHGDGHRIELRVEKSVAAELARRGLVCRQQDGKQDASAEESVGVNDGGEPRSFARVEWFVEDVLHLRPDWTTEDAEKFLQENETLIQHFTARKGWDLIGDSLPYFERKLL